MTMRTASWDELHPDATYYGWMIGQHVRVGELTLGQAALSAQDDGGWVMALLGSEIVRVPDGDPPAKPSFAELQRASDEAELAWVVASQPHARLDSEAYVYYRARIGFLRARLAEVPRD